MKGNLKTEKNRGLKSVKPTPWLEKGGGGLKRKEVELELDDKTRVGFRQAERSREGPAGNSVNRAMEVGRPRTRLFQ